MSLEIELPDVDELEKQADAAQQADRETDQQTGRKGVRQAVQVFADAWFRTPARIACTAVVALACVGLIGWNLQRLSVLDELVAAEVAEFELEDKLSDLQLALTLIDMPALTEALEAENERVFQGFPELAAWAQGLSRLAQKQDLQFSYRVEPAHAAAVPGLLEVPVRLEFKASAQSADSLFIDSMNLIGLLLGNHWHLEVISTHGKGNGERLDQVSLRAQVWVRDRFGFVDASSLQEVLPTAGEAARQLLN